ncbi:hypothetical protein BH24ACI5_BH24ACI5_26460 [soil metagenome]
MRVLQGAGARVLRGSWKAVQKAGGTTMTYELTARPGFDVPGFVLKRLLKRDPRK